MDTSALIDEHSVTGFTENVVIYECAVISVDHNSNRNNWLGTLGSWMRWKEANKTVLWTTWAMFLSRLISKSDRMTDGQMDFEETLSIQSTEEGEKIWARNVSCNRYSVTMIMLKVATFVFAAD